MHAECNPKLIHEHKNNIKWGTFKVLSVWDPKPGHIKEDLKATLQLTTNTCKHHSIIFNWFVIKETMTSNTVEELDTYLSTGRHTRAYTSINWNSDYKKSHWHHHHFPTDKHIHVIIFLNTHVTDAFTGFYLPSRSTFAHSNIGI